nr:polysaccharide biosynthesis protein [Actinomycetota bacterium]
WLHRHHWGAIVSIGRAALDCLMWTMAFVLVFAFISSLDSQSVSFARVVLLALIAVLAHLATGSVLGLYAPRSSFASFAELGRLASAAMSGTGLSCVVTLWMSQPRLAPPVVPAFSGLLALLLMALTRYVARTLSEAASLPSHGRSLRRLLIFGAGQGGAEVIASLLRDAGSSYLPVGLIDDDPSKVRLRIMGVPVLGDRSRLVEAAAMSNADALLIAVPSAGPELIAEMSEQARIAGLEVKVLPPVWELFGPAQGSDIQDVTTADLLGRHEISIDLESIAGYLTGRRVLVTGAGGSVGFELCRQIYRFAPARLFMLDRDESALHGVQLAIEGRALLDSPDLILCDLRDREAIEQVFARLRPEIVFHAAALKHLTLLEQHPREAVKTNIWATLDLLEISADIGVKRFINLSADKAADPCSVLGYSKRITERLTSHFGRTSPGAYLSVRFGNVLGSRGSILTTFMSQIEHGGPITVTDPHVSRYFMTIEEAVQLIIQSGAVGGEGETLVLDMGKPVVIAEIARLMAARSARRIGVEFTGLRPGEKLHEVLLGTGEVDVRPAHPLITHVAVPPLEPRLAHDINLMQSDEAIIGYLRYLCFPAGNYAYQPV